MWFLSNDMSFKNEISIVNFLGTYRTKVFPMNLAIHGEIFKLRPCSQPNNNATDQLKVILPFKNFTKEQTHFQVRIFFSDLKHEKLPEVQSEINRPRRCQELFTPTDFSSKLKVWNHSNFCWGNIWQKAGKEDDDDEEEEEATQQGSLFGANRRILNVRNVYCLSHSRQQRWHNQKYVCATWLHLYVVLPAGRN